MNFKHVYTSSKTYIILLIVALALILFMAGMAYKQIMRMQESSELVNHTLRVYNTISDLSGHYNKADSEVFRGKLLKKDSLSTTLKKYRLEGNAIVDSLSLFTINSEAQQRRIKSLNILLGTLYDQLHAISILNPEENQESQQITYLQKNRINATLFQIRSIKNTMQSEEEYLMHLRKADYASHKYLAPLTSLLLAFFALFTCFISFLRIYKSKLRIKQSEGFLKSVLATTDNIVNYYEPIFDDDKNITDFKIVFANACNRDYLGIEPDDIIDRPLSEVQPLYKMQGELTALKNCYINQSKADFEQQITIKEEAIWFKVFVTPLSDGVLTTARNITAEEHAKQEQFVFKKRLEDQNLKLLDSRALLGNIFKSITHIIMHFLSIRDKAGKIIDFEIVFVNDRINPVTGAIPDDLKNKRVSKIFPEIFDTGVFEHLVDALENNQPQEYEVPYERDGRKQLFRATAIKLGDGVTVTTREVTQEKEKEAELLNLNDQLAVQNSILLDAERIAKTGSFLWDREDGTAEISDNFYKLLGHESKEFKLNFEKYRDFIHPEDVGFYDKIGKDILESGVHKEYMYRIITKNDEIKYLKTNGQDIIKNGKKIMVGVVQDVTETIKAEEVLRIKNLELTRSNTELESFNRVSSHDLQEPLRKIRLFISRIQDKEGEKFSSTSSEYFEKVKNAVERMQSLIQNLLDYSRIDSSQEDFETLDLNEVLDKVTEDLSARIKETEAKLNADKLPIMKGLVFQMEQLFANLISNALKYRNLNEIPSIQIKYKKIDASKISAHFTKTSKYYHKISIIDNGIGFEPEYEQKIFEVFQRLHQKTEYTGTGIGLAICKKIIENHNGHIHAIGKINKGAAFVVYLPVY